MGTGKEFGMWNSETGIKEKDNHESTPVKRKIRFNWAGEREKTRKIKRIFLY